MPDAFVFGYGSLIETSSRRRTVDTAGDAVPACVEGLRRSWEVSSRPGRSAQTFLGVTECERAICNGVVFPVSRLDLVALDERESGYRRVRIAHEAIDPMVATAGSWLGDASVFTYVSLKPTPPSPRFPVGQAYARTCLRGCVEIDGRYHLGGDFLKLFVEQTVAWSQCLADGVGA